MYLKVMVAFFKNKYLLRSEKPTNLVKISKMFLSLVTLACVAGGLVREKRLGRGF